MGLIPRDLWDSPAVDKTLRLKLQHRSVLELLVDSFTGSKTDTIEKVFGQRTPTATSVHQRNLTDHQNKVAEPLLSGYTQQACSQTEGLARVFVVRWKTTARSGRDLRWKVYGSTL
jgi:hypothetical protein